MSNLSWCDLNNKGNLLKVQNVCPNARCKCQKQVTFTPDQIRLGCSRLEKGMRKIFEGTGKKLNSFIKPGLKSVSPNISAGVVAKTNNLQAGEMMSNVFESIAGGKTSSPTESNGNG